MRSAAGAMAAGLLVVLIHLSSCPCLYIRRCPRGRTSVESPASGDSVTRQYATTHCGSIARIDARSTPESRRARPMHIVPAPPMDACTTAIPNGYGRRKCFINDTNNPSHFVFHYIRHSSVRRVTSPRELHTHTSASQCPDAQSVPQTPLPACPRFKGLARRCRPPSPPSPMLAERTTQYLLVR